jgi:DNA-binding MarR family transcriptional regulator
VSQDGSRDFVDDLIDSWAGRPDLDVSPMAVATRLARVRDHLEGEMAAVYGDHGLTAQTFVMLATLTRLSGAGEPVTDDRLAGELSLTAATVSGRTDRLVADGLATRGADGALTFTDEGRALADDVVRAHLARLADVLGALDVAEREQLATLLRKLLVALEGPR